MAHAKYGTMRRAVMPAVVTTALIAGGAAQLFAGATAAHAAVCATESATRVHPGYSMQMPVCASSTAVAARHLARGARRSHTRAWVAHTRPHNATTPVTASYTHTPAPNSGSDLSPGSGPVMTSTTMYYVWWLPTGQHFESDSTGDTNYENLLVRFANDLGSTQFHNLVTQYSGTNGTTGNAVTYGGSWLDTSSYPHAGTTGDPLQDSDIQTEVSTAAATNGWTVDVNHIVAVFTANGIQECDGGTCTYTGGGNGFCAYHNHFSDSGNDAVYAFMAFDNFSHVPGYTCVAGQTGGDNDPNRGVYPNGDVSADAEINTLSHEVIESETDPHPNATWTGPNGEIGDACNFNFAPRNDSGADVYLNGDPYILQQEYSNATHTCGTDLPTNGYCAGSVSSACSPSTTYTKSVDVANPRVLSSIHYTITLDNTSDTAAETNLTATDTVPAGYVVTNLAAPGSQASSSSSSAISVSYDTLPVHQSRTITITATVPAQAGVAATNCADLTGSDLIGTALADEGSNCVVTTPVKIPTILQYTGSTTSDFNDATTVSAVLTDDSFTPLSGKTVDFSLNASETCSATTDVFGSASCSITPGEAAGSYTLTASFDDTSDPVYATGSTSAAFTVTAEETTTAYTGPTVILAGGSGVTLSGRLLEDGTTPIAGRTLTLGVGSQTCLAGPTDLTGSASCTLTVSGALGGESLSASFAGDAYYLASSDTSQTATVFAFPSRGAFTLGNVSVASAGPTTTLTWWGSDWAKLNKTSFGPSPASFKGFASLVHLPSATPPGACSATWASVPGNSAPPTSDVPSYMGVIVTGSVTKSGAGISGTQLHIVVVKVNPGYGPEPSSPGTGTIVATYC